MKRYILHNWKQSSPSSIFGVSFTTPKIAHREIHNNVFFSTYIDEIRIRHGGSDTNNQIFLSKKKTERYRTKLLHGLTKMKDRK